MASRTQMMACAALAAAAAGVRVTIFLINLYRKKRKERNVPPKKWKAVGKVKTLNVYPVDTARGIEVEFAEIGRYGLSTLPSKGCSLTHRDRGFVIYELKKHYIRTAKNLHNILLLQPDVGVEGWYIMKYLDWPIAGIDMSEVVKGRVVKLKGYAGDEFFAYDCGNEMSYMISMRILGKNNGLRMAWAGGDVRFKRTWTQMFLDWRRRYENIGSDFLYYYNSLQPLTLINQKSVNDVARRLPSPAHITPRNFRPSILVDGKDEDLAAYDEDHWDWIKINDVILKNVRPNTRLALTARNRKTGEHREDGQPLAILNRCRKLEKVRHMEFDIPTIVFGANLQVHTPGILSTNAVVYVS